MVSKVYFVYSSEDRSIVTRYVNDLERRDIQTGQLLPEELKILLQLNDFQLKKFVIVWTDKSSRDPALLDALELLKHKNEILHKQIIVLIKEPVNLERIILFSTIKAHYKTYDLSFEELLKQILGPFPSWLKMFCRPSQILKPTGGTWWDNSVILADEYYGHLLKVQSSDTSVLLAGLDEPYHIDIDRRLVALTNLGTNSIIYGKIQPGGVLADLQELKSVLGIELQRPHGVFQGNNYSIIADTDNHRVVFKRGHLRDAVSEWGYFDREISFPCDVHGAGDSVWIADTFNNRIVNVDFELKKIVSVLDGKAKAKDETDDFPSTMSFPVSVHQWNDYLFITDEQNKRLKVYRLVENKFVAVSLGLGFPFIASPLGLCVNMDSCLLVTDRTQGCCWTIDLKIWLREKSTDSPTE